MRQLLWCAKSPLAIAPARRSEEQRELTSFPWKGRGEVMRNIFGYAATAVAAGAVSFFAAAGYADQNPESFLGSCFHQVRYLCRSGTETASPCTEATSPC